jgi:hypothetical protein
MVAKNVFMQNRIIPRGEIPNTGKSPEPVFLNVNGAPELIPRNKFSQPMKPGGPVQKPYSSSMPSPHRLFKNSSSDL